MNPPDELSAYPMVDPPIRSAGTVIRSASPLSPPDGESVDEYDLLQRMAAGDEAALGLMYDRYAVRLHSLAHSLLGDADEAEDVVEDAFWQVWRMASRYDRSRGSVSTWLLMITRSRALDRARARRRSPVEAVGEQEPPNGRVMEGARSEGPLEDAATGERRERVARALKELPPEQRRVIELAFYRGWSQAEIAERTGEPLGTVKTRVRLAMKKLRERLAILREEEL